MADIRAAFLMGSSSRSRRLAIACKYAVMRAQRLIYPDVYCLPLAFARSVAFVRPGKRLSPRRYDVAFAELNGSEWQLRTVHDAIRTAGVPVIVLPGPPEVLAAALQDDPDGRKRDLAGRVLRDASA